MRSKEPSASMAPPTDSMASAISSDVRVSVPSSSKRLTMIASPAFPSESHRAPASTLAFIETVGTEGFSTSNTFNPLPRTRLWTSNALRRPSSVGFIVLLLSVLLGPITDQAGNGTVVLVEILTADGGYIGCCNGVDPLQIRID